MPEIEFLDILDALEFSHQEIQSFLLIQFLYFKIVFYRSRKPQIGLGDVHKLRNALGKGGQRFVTNRVYIP